MPNYVHWHWYLKVSMFTSYCDIKTSFDPTGRSTIEINVTGGLDLSVVKAILRADEGFVLEWSLGITISWLSPRCNTLDWWGVPTVLATAVVCAGAVRRLGRHKSC